MLAGTFDEEGQRFGAGESQKEKEIASADKERNTGSLDQVWTYPDGGWTAWATVLVRFLLLYTACSCLGAEFGGSATLLSCFAD